MMALPKDLHVNITYPALQLEPPVTSTVHGTPPKHHNADHCL